jgi:hypothetical protein
VKVVVRNPRFKVRIVTHDGTELTFESLKGAIRSIRVTKRIGEAGAFQLEVPDDAGRLVLHEALKPGTRITAPVWFPAGGVP